MQQRPVHFTRPRRTHGGIRRTPAVNRGLLLIPPYVVHAVQNIGEVDAYFINLPTVPYNHASPDKFRVAPETVPYRFDKPAGW